MASLTFMAGKHHVTVRTKKQRKPTGLAAVGWVENGVEVNIRVDGITHQNHGSIYTHTKGGYYIAVGSISGICGHINTARAKKQFPSIEVALTAIAAWIKMEVKRLDSANASNS